MSLFDTLDLDGDIECPACGKKIERPGIQFKLRMPAMLHFRVGDSLLSDEDLRGVYGKCPHCGVFIECDIVVEGGKFAGIRNVRAEK